MAVILYHKLTKTKFHVVFEYVWQNQARGHNSCLACSFSFCVNEFVSKQASRYPLWLDSPATLSHHAIITNRDPTEWRPYPLRGYPTQTGTREEVVLSQKDLSVGQREYPGHLSPK